jgi:hypothetical protein
MLLGINMTVESPAPIRFGFLPIEWIIEFDYGKIVAIPEFKKVSRIIKKHLHHDGHFYPPTLESVIAIDLVNSKKTRKTKRPAFLYPVPPSHDLFLTPPNPEANIREGSAGFILHLLAFLFHTRLQFADWFYDGRIPIDLGSREIHHPSQAGRYLSLAYRVWSGWPPEEQKRFTNILYMHSRRFVYEWEWEKFINQYLVLDACWKMAEMLFGLTLSNVDKSIKGLHRRRLAALRDEFDLLGDDFIDSEKLATLRNNLFHEVLWHGVRPGSARNRLDYHMPMRLAILNQQLIFALISQSARKQKLI